MCLSVVLAGVTSSVLEQKEASGETIRRRRCSAIGRLIIVVDQRGRSQAK